MALPLTSCSPGVGWWRDPDVLASLALGSAINPEPRVVIGSLLVGWQMLVLCFRPEPRHRRKNRVPSQRPQKLAGESLLADADSGGGDWKGELRIQAARYPARWKMIYRYCSRTADGSGTPEVKVPAALPAARENGCCFSHGDPLALHSGSSADAWEAAPLH